MTSENPRRAARRIPESDGVLDDLRKALHDAGVTLPSLRLHHSTWSSSDPRAPGLIELGGCPLDTARLLTAALRRAVA
ncbi:hypothetical protein [Streptomyces sp. NPDC048644]|uniref:hypothetical protein n=1 Tax=Streptomyces sp. NPDC048644 TaxID=3365582 RepID=UPI00370F952C